MIISVTERQQFKRCRRLWDFASYNRQALQPIVSKPSLILGGLVHAALKLWVENPDKSLVNLFTGVCVEAEAKAIETYKTQMGFAPDDMELKAMYDSITFGLVMAENYEKKWKTPLPKGMSLVTSEQSVLIDIPGTYYPHDHGTMFYHLEDEYNNHIEREHKDTPVGVMEWHNHIHKLNAKFDAILKDKEDNLYILEHKTGATHPRLSVLESNDQFLAYIWVLTQMNIGNVEGIAYDFMWKRDKIPKKSSFDDLFLRLILRRDRSELEEFERELALEANEMANPNVSIYKTIPYDGCGDCIYEQLCRSVSRGEDTEFMKNKFFYKNAN